MTPTPMHERNHPVNTPQPDQLRKAERVLRLIWVVAGGAIIFSMLTVTPLVQRVTAPGWEWTAPILPLVVDAAVIIVVRMDSEVSRLGAKAGGWATVLRWMTGLFTLALNIGDSALKGDMVGVGVHSVAPLLLIATSEAIPRYRRTVALGLERIAREQADERRRREQAAADERDRERQAREQAEQRREQVERERIEAEQRAVREQREHEARLVREQREFEAALEQQRQDREDAREREKAARQAELDRLAAEARERREREQRAERERVERQAREQAQAAVRERPAPAPAAPREQASKAPREHRPLHSVNSAVNTPKAKQVDAEKVDEDTAVNMVRAAVDSDKVSIRGLARSTGWSVGWVSKQVAEMRGEQVPDGVDGEQVPA